MKSIYSVIKTPLVTEKASQIMPLRKYLFRVDRRANKIEIKKAVEKLYSVKVERISSAVVKGKTKRLRWNQPGKTASWKKVFVTLREGFEIKVT